jgi:hypothetical protein
MPQKLTNICRSRPHRMTQTLLLIFFWRGCTPLKTDFTSFGPFQARAIDEVYGSLTVRPKKKFRTLPLEVGHVSAFSVVGGVFERNRLVTRTNANPAGLLVTYPSQTAAKHNIWDSNKLPQRSGQFVFRIASNEIRLNVLKVV